MPNEAASRLPQIAVPDGPAPADIRTALADALDHMTQSLAALRDIASVVYDARTVVEAGNIAAEAAGLRAMMLPEVLMEGIIDAAAVQFGTSAEAILSARKTRREVTARWVAAWMGRRRGLSLTEIGRALRMDHSSVAHGIRRIDETFAAQGEG